MKVKKNFIASVVEAHIDTMAIVSKLIENFKLILTLEFFLSFPLNFCNVVHSTMYYSKAASK